MPFLPSTQEQLASFRAAADNGVAIVHVATCLPSFLQDHHNRDGECLFGVYLDGSTTVRVIRHNLRMEIRETGDRVPDEVTDEMIAAAIDAAFDGADLSAIFDSSLELWAEDDSDGGSESCQAWFVLTWEVPDE